MRPSAAETLGLQTIIIRKSCQDILGTYGYGSGVQIKKSKLGRCPTEHRRLEVFLTDPGTRSNVLTVATYEKMTETSSVGKTAQELSREEMGPENSLGRRLRQSLAKMSSRAPLVLTVDPEKKVLLEFNVAVSAKTQGSRKRR